MSSEAFVMQPIGVVRSPYTHTGQIPKGPGAAHEAEGVLEIVPALERGLTDIEGFSHLYVIWAFDRAAGYDLLATPPTDTRSHGVFATRAPRRPNPIGLTVVRLLRRDGARLVVRGVDMLDGTPILDIKPYLSSVAAEDLRRGWLAEAEGAPTALAPERFARDWAAAWNARDLDAVLAHFTDDVVFSTPKALDAVGRPTVRGKASLRAYWETALTKITTLHFTVIRTVWDGTRRELGIVYDREVNGHRDRALELLRFTPGGLIASGEVFYGVLPAPGD